MNNIAIGTTPTVTLRLAEEVDFSATEHVYLTLKQNTRRVEKEDGDVTIDGRNLSVYLTQEESLRFDPRYPVKLQANWTYANGERGCTEEVEIKMSGNLRREVLP